MEQPASVEDAVERPSRHRAFSLAVVGMCAVVWWPAFTLGAWGELFFDQQLTVWVVATAALVVVLVQPPSLGRRWPRMVALGIPSLWLALAFIPDPGDIGSFLIFLLGAVVGIVGIPFTLWTLTIVLWPDMFGELRLRARFGVLAIVALIALAAYLLGINQEYFLTCQEFTISGNSAPRGCVDAP